MNRRLMLGSLLGLALTAGCRSKSKRTPHIRVEDFGRGESGDPIIRIACAGDSITYGAGVEDREKKCYPARLNALLGPRFDVRNLGRNGATASSTGDLSYRSTDEFKALQEFRPEVIILALGTNDTKPQNWKGKEAFETEYRNLLAVFKGMKPRPRIWACFPPPVYRDAWGINAQTLDDVMDAIESACDREKIPVIDLHDALSGNPAWFPDGIHPDARGADAIATTVFQAVRP